MTESRRRSECEAEPKEDGRAVAKGSKKKRSRHEAEDDDPVTSPSKEAALVTADEPRRKVRRTAELQCASATAEESEEGEIDSRTRCAEALAVWGLRFVDVEGMLALRQVCRLLASHLACNGRYVLG